MSNTSRRYTQEFKLAVLRHLQRGHTIPDVAAAFAINVSTLYRWNQEAEKAARKATSAQKSNPDVQK